MLLPLVLLLAACGSSGGSSSGSNDQGGSPKKTKVSIILGTPAVMPMYPFYIAKEKGYFADEGLDVTINTSDGTAQSAQAAASGSVDIVGGTTTGLLEAAASQTEYHPLMFFWSFVGSPLYVGAPDDSGINTAADLKGKTIGVSALSGVETTTLKNLASSAGLKDGVDYKIQPVGGGGQAVIALEKGVIDAYAGGINDLAIITARGIPMHKVTAPGVQSPYGFGLWTTQEYAKEHPEVLRAFSRAYKKAWDYIGDDAQKLADTVAEISPQEGEEPKVALALAASSIQLRKPQKGLKLGYIPPDDFHRWWDNEEKAGAIDGIVGGPDDHFTNKFNGAQGA